MHLQIVPSRGMAKFAVTFFATEAANYSALLLGNSTFKVPRRVPPPPPESEHSSRSSAVLVLMEEEDPTVFPLPFEVAPSKTDDSLRPRQLSPLQVHADAILEIPR